MIGRVSGRQARINVSFQLPAMPVLDVEFVIDTGFEGYLTLLPAALRAMGLPFDQQIETVLADGSRRLINAHRATILWHGQALEILVLAMGRRPLLGTLLLDGNDLSIRFA